MILRGSLLWIFLLVLSFPIHGDVFEHAVESGKGAFDKPGLIILGVGAVATAIAANHDQLMHDNWVNHQRMSEGTADIGDFWGTGIPASTIILGQLIFDPDNGIPSLEGVLWSTGTSFALKYTVRRPRPGMGTKTSFPSGHTQAAFSSATTILYSYGWAASVPFYAMGVLTGLSRMADNAHWFSDVVAGAFIGILFGRSGFGHHNLSLTTMEIDRDDQGFGLALTYRY